MKNLRLRTKLLAIAIPPLVILAVLVAYALKASYLGSGSVDGAAMQEDLRVLSVVGMAGFVGSALVLVLVTRSVTGPLDRLTRAADELSGTRLPALVEQLRDPSVTPPEPAEPLGLDSDDELGRLARAIDAVQEVATEVTAAQQGLVRESLSTLVINLARRNQAMLERQLSFIDQLETSEQDPDRLEDLYRLDHLATRMRRNAESLLVLAGAEPARRRGAPVQLLDVVRVAIGEIEDYRHVQLGAIQDVEVGSNVAVDLAHLLSELMENATQFSPPDAPVVVESGWVGDGSYAIAVVDQGIGMGDEQLADANTVLASPPELGLDLSRSLGFLVIGRLARRLGVTVQLRPADDGGIAATVLVPAELVIGAGMASVDTPAVEQPDLIQLPSGPVPDLLLGAAPNWPLPARADDPPAPDLPIDQPTSPRVDDVTPAALTGDGPAVGDRAVPPAPPVPIDPSAPRFDAAPIPVRADVPVEPGPATAPTDDVASGGWWMHPSKQRDPAPAGGGLLDELRRVSGPRNLADALPEGDVFDQGITALLSPDATPASPPPVEPPVAAPAGPDRTDAGLVRRRRGEQAPAEQVGRPVAASTRSPEEIREMLARYRSGIKHRRPAGNAHDEEATR